MPPGKIHAHWVTLRSHDDPETDDVASGAVCLGTDGSTIYMTTADGTTTPINGSAVMKDIVLDDDAAAEFQVRESTNTYLLVNTTDGSEVVKVGNSDVASVSVQLLGQTVDVTSSGDTTIDASGTVDVIAAGVATIQGGSINLGGSGNGDILVGTTGTRDIDVGSANATEVTLATSGASLELSATGAAHLVASTLTWTVGRTGLDYITVDDDDETVSLFSTVVVDATTVTITGDVAVTGTVDGVDLSTLASIANGQGCSQLGVEDAGTYYAGADVEAVLQEVGASLGAVPANASDLADMDTTGVADKNVLWYVTGDSEFQPVTPATMAAEVSLSDLGDVDAAAPAEGEVLTWDNAAGEWVAAATAVTGGANSEFEPAALSTEGVFEVRSGIDQEILFTEGARIHVSFAVTVAMTGNPAGELRVGLILEDDGGSPIAYFATNADLGGDTDVEISGHITLSLGPADSADAGERNVYVSGHCLRETTGASAATSVRVYDDSGHAPLAYPDGLKVADVGSTYDHLTFAVLTTSDAHDGSNKYDVTVQAITVDMFEGT